MELKSFQIEASEQIAERYESYMNDPLYIRKMKLYLFIKIFLLLREREKR